MRPLSSVDRTLWLLLIDVSGSMKETFRGTGRFQGFVEVGEYRSKLQAAKESLLKQIRGLGPDTDVAIISFSDSASQVYAGSPDNTEEIRRSIELLEPSAGTNIAGALNYACELPKERGHRWSTALVITDGLSNIGDPVQAARLCAERGISISTLLIDDTREGEEIARSISIGGRVTAVCASATLDATLRSEIQEHRRTATASKPEESKTPILAAIAATFAAFAALTTAFFNATGKPLIGLLAFASAVSMIVMAISSYFYFARKDLANVLAPNGQVPEYRIPAYGRVTRRVSLVAGLVSILVALTSFYLAFVPLQRAQQTLDAKNQQIQNLTDSVNSMRERLDRFSADSAAKDRKIQDLTETLKNTLAQLDRSSARVALTNCDGVVGSVVLFETRGILRTLFAGLDGTRSYVLRVRSGLDTGLTEAAIPVGKINGTFDVPLPPNVNGVSRVDIFDDDHRQIGSCKVRPTIRF